MVKRNKYMNVPEIRFKGLDKTWNKKTLDELVQLNSGMDYKHLCNGNIPVYGTGGYMLSVNAALSYDKDAIGIGRKGTINKPYILKAPFWTVDTLFYAIPRKCNCIFQRIDWLKYDESTGVPSLSKNIINSIEVNCAPSYDEQQKIASYFQSLDSLIQTTSKKLVSLKQIKDASLQSMFPQEGETVPKVRFKGFEGEWEKIPFGSFLKESYERSTVENEDILLSSAITGVYLNSELFGHQRGASNIGYKKIKKNMLILSTQNLHLGNANVNLRFEHGLISPAYKVYEIVNISPLFLQQWIKMDSTKVFFLNATTAGASLCRKNIVWDDLYKQIVLIPSKNEQVKIGLFFSNLDKQISLQTQRLEKLKQIKAACLDKMFV